MAELMEAVIAYLVNLAIAKKNGKYAPEYINK